MESGNVVEKITCECGKVVSKKSMLKHLSSVKHCYWKLQKEQIDRLGDWTLESFEMVNPMNTKED